MIALVGASIVSLGLVQILTGAREILWQPDVPNAGYFFATYFHHSLGGAFINLVWPLLAGLFLVHATRAVKLKWWLGAAIVWWLLLLVSLCGLLAQLSRFAQFNALLLLAGWLGWLLWRGGKRIIGKLLCGFLLIGIVVGLVMGASAVRLGKLPEIVGRWDLLLRPKPATPPQVLREDFRIRPDGFILSTQEGAFLGDRGVAATTCLRMIPKSGLLGFGPGSWAATYPHFTEDPFVRTFFLYLQFAHSDWLQTVVEWGLLGALGWALLVAGGFRQILRRLRWTRRMKTGLGRREILSAAVLASLVGILIHGSIDFPLQIPSLQLYFIVLLGLAWRSAPLALVIAEREARTQLAEDCSAAIKSPGDLGSGVCQRSRSAQG